MKKELLDYFYEIGKDVFQVRLYDFEYLLMQMRRFRDDDGNLRHPNSIEAEIRKMVDSFVVIKRGNGFGYVADDWVTQMELDKVNRFPFTWWHLVCVLNKFPDLVRQYKEGNVKVLNVIVGKTSMLSNKTAFPEEIIWCFKLYMRDCV